MDGAPSAAQDVPMAHRRSRPPGAAPAPRRFGLPPLGSPAARRLDGTVTAVISGPGGLLMLAVAPLVPQQRLMAGAGLGAVLVAIWAWLLPADAGMWQRHAYTAASVPTTVLGTAAAEISTGLRLGPAVLLCPMIAVACLRRSRSVMGQLVLGVAAYTAYLFVTLPPSVAVVGALAGGAALVMVTVMVSVLRCALDTVVIELREQAERDPLTGLLNRHGLQVAMAGCTAATGAVILMDLDHFKTVNDVHGHQRGDETLIWFAGLIAAHRPGSGLPAGPGSRAGSGTPAGPRSRADFGMPAGSGALPRSGVPSESQMPAGSDVPFEFGVPSGSGSRVGSGVPAGSGIAARLGGEEFVLVLPGAAAAAALDCAEAIRSAVADCSVARPTPVTVSMGVAHGRLTDYPGLLSAADKALYRAKAAGRNRVVPAPPLP